MKSYKLYNNDEILVGCLYILLQIKPPIIWELNSLALVTKGF